MSLRSRFVNPQPSPALAILPADAPDSANQRPVPAAPPQPAPVVPAARRRPNSVHSHRHAATPHSTPVTDSEAAIPPFSAEDFEVRLATSRVGDVWLVPEYTGSGRKELTYGDARVLALVASTFPGAEVVTFERLPTKKNDTLVSPIRDSRPLS